MASQNDDLANEERPRVTFASKEGLVLASLLLYLIFYFMLSPGGFATKLEDPGLFKLYSTFFFIAFVLLLFTAVFLILLSPHILKNELLGMIFFIVGGIIFFLIPYVNSMSINFPMPDVGVGIVAAVFYIIGTIIFARDGGYFSAWVVGSTLTIALSGHEALGIIRSTGHFGPYDLTLWGLGTLTLLTAFILFVIYQVKLRLVLAPWVKKGNEARRAGKYSEALEHFDRCLKWHPTFVTALNNKGNVLMNMGKYNEARECYEKALKLDPFYRNAKKNLAVLKRKVGGPAAGAKPAPGAA